MIVVFPFSIKDQDQALRLTTWINELGGCRGHHVLCCYDHRCDPLIVESIGQGLINAFDKVFRLEAKAAIDGWPEGANYMFRLCSAWLAERPQYPCFFWLEPDAIPISPGWMDTLEAEYRRGGKPFMGERVDLGEKRPDVPVHMSGVGIYENPVYMRAGEAYRAAEVAWDIAAKDQIIPNAYFTKMIQHYWKHGTFTSLDGIRPETVVFHSSKDGSLIDLLRSSRDGEVQGSQEERRVAHNHAIVGSIPTPATQIKILPHSGIWVLAGDTIISDEVERHERLDFDPLLPHVLPLIRPGDTVVDVGAFIGDHTIAYSHAVGKSGKVFAYEPNALAFQCLVHNTDGMSNVFGFCHALGESNGTLNLTNSPNAASNYLTEDPGNTVKVKTLDIDAALFSQLDLMKIDVEGYELHVLKGAELLIEHYHPKLVVEINEIALARQNVTKEDVISWVVRHGYDVSILHRHKDAPFYDILGLPAAKPPESFGSVPVAHTTPESQHAPATPVAPPSLRQALKGHIDVLKSFAETDPQAKAIVFQLLVYAGLREPNKKKHGKPQITKSKKQRRPALEERQI